MAESLETRLYRWQAKIAALQGWRRRLVAFILGLLAVGALPPLHLIPILIPAFVGLIWLIDGSAPVHHKRRWRFLPWRGSAAWSAYRTGWWFGLGFFAAGLYWISLSFLVDAAQYGWMIPFAILGLAGGLAIFIGFAALTSFSLARQGPGRILMFAAMWVAFEMARSFMFTGFPWNLLGTVWTISDAVIQFASLAGVFGLSLVTVAAAAGLAVFGYQNVSRRQSWGLTLAVFGALFVVWAGGGVRLAGAVREDVPNVILRLVQPNIAQRDKWKRNLRAQHLEQLIAMSKNATATHVIWPETAVPLFLANSPSALSAVAMAAPANGALLTGAPRRLAGAGYPSQLWNAMHVIDAKGNIRASYDKFHLVPFGEYVPFRGVLNLSALVGRVDFSPGPGRLSIAVPGAPAVGPLICYEAVFPASVVTGDDDARPGWLLNLTNDAWFGMSSGPYQHFAATRLRAVEEGLPLVRVANTGISAVIDSYGRIVTITKLGEKIAVNSPLPQKLASRTLFSIAGNWVALVLLTICIGFSRLYYLDSSSQITT